MTTETLEVPTLKVDGLMVINIVQKILLLGAVNRATEIIFTPPEKEDKVCTVKFNDGSGNIRPLVNFPKNLTLAIQSRLKIMGHLSMSEKKIAQIGARVAVDIEGGIFRILIFTTIDEQGEIVRIQYLIPT